MKRILSFTVFLLLLGAVSYAQTQEERQKIISTYNQEQINELTEELKALTKKQNDLVNDYLLSNNLDRKFPLENGGLAQIRYIIDGRPVYVTTDNVNSAISTRTNFLQAGGSLGLNLEGQNMHVATWDGGPTLATHQEFLNYDVIPVTRVDNPDLSSSNDQSNHSTHVSGTIIAKGVQPSAKGMAPRATLTSFDWDNDDVEALTEATTNGLLLSNHSYGVPVSINGSQNAPTWMMGCYDTDARTWDQVAYNAPYYLQVASAGNDGTSTYTGGLANNYDKLTGNKNSKNNLVVANANNPLINPNGSGQLLSMFINTSSSQGPSDDGRIKPDITADGTSVFSSISTSNSAYANYSGTSMSAPNTTGTLLLIQQYYNDLNASYMRSSTLKGLVCHTADDDSSIPGPDAIFGWGLLNAKASVETILKATTNEAVITERTLNNGDTYTFDFNVSGTEPLKATICWTDPAGADRSGTLNSPIPALVNDLDIRLTNGGTTYYPWKLQLSNVSAQAIKDDNIVDTVEMIEIKFPTAGTYTLTVSHKGSLTNGAQPYALIVTGSDLTLGTEDVEISGVNVWPNPASDMLHVSFKTASNKTSIDIYDVNGRKVYAESLLNPSSLDHAIDISDLSNGLYFVTIDRDGQKLNKKIVIE